MKGCEWTTATQSTPYRVLRALASLQANSATKTDSKTMPVPSTATNRPFRNYCKTQGYQTAIVGKWHLISTPQGFDHWSILSGQHEQGDYYNPDFLENGKAIREEGYATDIITDESH